MDELRQPVLVVGGMLAVMWAMEVIDLVPGTPFDSWGIRPRTARGLLGIVLAPFLHSGFPHLIANSIPFALLGIAIAFSSVARFVQVVCIVGVISGLGTWLFGQSNSVHIGASGLVFGFVTYLVSRGIFARKLLWLLGGVIVVVVYGGILWGLLPRPGVSWTGHVFGAIGGVAAAWIMHGRAGDLASSSRASPA
ncbi:MAG: rhomboid family intramembrane serine protease [Ilumatobacteraceae bacterium]